MRAERDRKLALVDGLFARLKAATTQAEGNDVEIATEGVYDLAKMNGSEFTPGSIVYWDSATKTAADSLGTGAGDARVGVALETVGTTAPTIRTRLDGTVTV